jgi:hypothetical protein
MTSAPDKVAVVKKNGVPVDLANDVQFGMLLEGGLAASRAFADGLSAPASGKGGDFRYEPLGLIGIGIEVVADPFHELGMSLMSRILDGGEEFSITTGPPPSSGGR